MEINPSIRPGRVLVVDDDAPLRRLLTRVLEHSGHEVVPAADGYTALQHVARARFDLVFSDLAMPGLDGLQLLRAIREHDLDVPFVLLTGNLSIEHAVAASQYGAFMQVAKPYGLAQIRSVAARTISLGRIARAMRFVTESIGHGRHHTSDVSGLEFEWRATPVP